MALIYWRPTDEATQLTGNLHVQDDSDGWWGGVQQCFVGVAVALALAASAVVAQAQTIAIQPQDELVFQQVIEDDSFQLPPTGYIIPAVYPQPWEFRQDELVFQQVIEDDSFQLPPTPFIVPPVLFQQWPLETNDPAGLAGNLTVDEVYWLDFTPPIVPQPVVALPWSFIGDEIVPQAAAFISDEGEWNSLTAYGVPAAYQQPWSFIADEIVVQAAATGIDEEGFWQAPPPLVAGPTYPQPWAFWQDELVFAPVFEDDSISLGSAISPPVLLQQWTFEASEAPSQQVFEDDSSWTPPVAYVVPVPLFQQWSLFGDEIVAQPVVFQPDEDFWFNPNPPIQVIFWIPNPWVDDQIPTLHAIITTRNVTGNWHVQQITGQLTQLGQL